jgi:hypothetical protein
MMGYIVDLTVIMDGIFRMTPANVLPKDAQQVLERHVRSGHRDAIHSDIRSFIAEVLAIRSLAPQKGSGPGENHRFNQAVLCPSLRKQLNDANGRGAKEREGDSRRDSEGAPMHAFATLHTHYFPRLLVESDFLHVYQGIY